MREEDLSDTLRILLVEDSRGDMHAFRRAMSTVNETVAVTDVPYAEQALDMLQAPVGEAFGLCLFDINLPRMNGLELLKSAKRFRAATPMMVLSSSDSPQEIARAFANGADGYIVKPFDLNDYKAIARYLCGCWFDGVPPADNAYGGIVLPETAAQFTGRQGGDRALFRPASGN